MQAHGVARRLVQDQGEAIELHHLMEPAGQLVEQRGQIAVRRRSLPKRPARLGTASAAAVACPSKRSLVMAKTLVSH